MERGTTNTGPGFRIHFTDPPTYQLGYCSDNYVEFTMPPHGPIRVWTIRKENDKIKLDCNGVVIFDINYEINEQVVNGEMQCSKYWTKDFEAIQFQGSAEDYFRQLYPASMFFVEMITDFDAFDIKSKCIICTYNLIIIQLTVDGVITEIGQNVQLIVEEERKPEPGLVLTQLQLMVVQIVLGRRQKLNTATLNLVQVDNTTCCGTFAVSFKRIKLAYRPTRF